jgi:hypothetical protein
MLEGLSCPAPACVPGATRRLIAWAESDTAMPRPVLLVLLGAADVGTVPPATRRALAARLHTLAEPEPIVLIRLAELRDPAARRFLDELIQRHATRAISFGVAERQALVAGLAHDDSPDRFRRAASLVEASLQDSAERQHFGQSFDAGAVYAAYLALLVEDRGATWSAHRALVEKLLAWRGGDGSDSFAGAEFDDALGRLGATLPASALVGLLSYPRPPTLDPPWSPMWNTRIRLLRAITRDGRPLPDQIASLVAANLPVPIDASEPDPRRQSLESLLANAGGLPARRFLRDELAAGRKEMLQRLAENGDVDAVRGAIVASGGGAAVPFTRTEVLDAIDRLASNDARLALTLLVQQQPTARDDADVWSAAARAKLDHPELKRAAARALVAAPEDAHRLAVALRYLAALAPDEAWRSLGRADVSANIGTRLATIDAFEWESVMQELPEPARGSVQEGFAELVTSRIVLSVRDAACDAASGCFRIGERVVFEMPLLAHARGAADDAALAMLSGVAFTAPPSSVETDAPVEDPGGLLRAYALWLAAEVVQRADGRASRDLLSQLIRELDAANPRTSRAAASAVLAASHETLAAAAAGALP